MQRSMVSKTLASSNRTFIPTTTRVLPKTSRPSYDVFINHRGVDTKRTIAGLLHQHLSRLGFNPFLDCKSMRPGDRLIERIDPAIKTCRVGVAIMSPHYCDSYYCLHELALMFECKKKVIPVFCDVKPSELRIHDNMKWCPPKEREKFHRAIEEARKIVGLTFDTSKDDWSEFLTKATDSILQSLHESEEDEKCLSKKITKYYDESLC